MTEWLCLQYHIVKRQSHKYVDKMFKNHLLLSNLLFLNCYSTLNVNLTVNC